MTAIAATGRRLIQPRTPELTPLRITDIAVTATKHVKAGGMVMLVAAGTCEPGATGTGNVCLGVSQDDADNTLSLADPPKPVIRTGIYPMFQTGTTITKAHIGTTVYMADDQTVTLDDSGNSPAGTCVGIDDDGTSVLVAISPLLPITSHGFAIQSRTVTIVAGPSVGSKLGTDAGIGTGADTDNTNRVYPIGAAVPAGAIFMGLAIHLVTPFVNPLSSLALTVGGTDADGLVSAFDLVGSSAGYYDGTAGAQNIEAARVASVSGQQLTATLDPGATDKVSENTAGEVKITVFYASAA